MSTSRTPRLRDALFDVPAISTADWARAGPLLRWMIASRASVLAMTLFASLFGGLLALPWSLAAAGRLLLVTLALLVAHATNNLLNDHVDYRLGLDRDNYFRARYGAQPLSQGLMSIAAHRRMLVLTGSLALLLGSGICLYLGGAAYWLAGVGAVLLLFYTWPLKHAALGELAVFLVWGPLMVGGSFWAVSGLWRDDVLVLAILYGLGPTVVIFAKHTDKLEDDARRGVRTLPVLLGAAIARWSWVLLGALQLTGVVVFAVANARWGLLLVLGAAPALLHCFRLAAHPRPLCCPADYPANLWPLWYTAAGFRFARATGLLLVSAVLVDWLWGWW